MSTFKPYYRRFLPHYQIKESIYFITFCIAGALPAKIVAEQPAVRVQTLRAAQQIKNRARQREVVASAKHEYEKALEVQLDKPGPDHCCLADTALAAIVHSAILEIKGELFASCVMPSHVHLVVQTSLNLFEIIGSLKKFTARKCNILLKRKGRFWQPESFDRIIRDEEHLCNVVAYIRNNPVKAGLVSSWDQWPWTFIKSGW